MKSVSKILFIAFIVSFPTLVLGQSTPEIEATIPTPIDFNVKNVRLGTDYGEVVKRLGRPARRRLVKIDNCGASTQLALYYPGMVIYLDKGPDDKKYGVVSMEITGRKWIVAPNIATGWGMQTVRKKLGASFTSHRENRITVWGYITRDNDRGDLYFANGRLSRIRLWIDPC